MTGPIASLLPLLARYSLGFDLVAGPDDTVTLTVIPRKVAGASYTLDVGEVRPISITATAAEIDAELARGEEGALGQLIATRKALGDQLAEQRAAAEAAKTTAAAAKAKPAAEKAAKVPKEPQPPKTPAPPKPDKPAAAPSPMASLWEEPAPVPAEPQPPIVEDPQPETADANQPVD